MKGLQMIKKLAQKTRTLLHTRACASPKDKCATQSFVFLARRDKAKPTRQINSCQNPQQHTKCRRGNHRASALPLVCPSQRRGDAGAEGASVATRRANSVSPVGAVGLGSARLAWVGWLLQATTRPRARVLHTVSPYLSLPLVLLHSVSESIHTHTVSPVRHFQRYVRKILRVTCLKNISKKRRRYYG